MTNDKDRNTEECLSSGETLALSAPIHRVGQETCRNFWTRGWETTSPSKYGFDVDEAIEQAKKGARAINTGINQGAWKSTRFAEPEIGISAFVAFWMTEEEEDLYPPLTSPDGNYFAQNTEILCKDAHGWLEASAETLRQLLE